MALSAQLEAVSGASMTVSEAIARFPTESVDAVLQTIASEAQKLTRAESGVVALLGAKTGPPTLLFAQSAGGAGDLGALLKQIVSARGGRGGGNRDMAQGGVPTADVIDEAIVEAAAKARG